MELKYGRAGSVAALNPPANLWHPFRMPGTERTYSNENSEEPFIFKDGAGDRSGASW